MTTMTTIGHRAFAVFWCLLHAYAVIFAVVFRATDTRPWTADPFGVALILAVFAVGPLAILAISRWVLTGAWRLGPRW